MRKLYYYMAAALLLLAAGCQYEEIASFEQDDDVLEVYASIEDIEDAQTRTYLSGSEVYWSSGDQIAVFYKNTLRKRFDVTPESIDSKNATFLLDEGYVQMGSNVKVSHNVAYYPFCDVICASYGSSYTLSNLILPSIQPYVEESVGLGAFPMVAVTANTDDVNFRFKNLCGVMQFQLTGCGFVKSVSVKGNREEILAGPAAVTAGYGKEPSISMSAEGAKEVILDCGESGVELNETTPVSFFISLPPVQFEGGFTITVTDTWGGSKEYSTTKKNPVGRSKGLRMPAKEYIGVRPPQEGDYIDEYGVNHGQGIEIDGVVWAPVNCGYHETDFKYGKLYQWGRKYGQGYSGKLYDINGDNVGKYSDSKVPELLDGPVSLSVAQSESNAGKFIYDTPRDWHIVTDVNLWNAGTEDNPVKTEYDPCPKGWRVPTYIELVGLSQNYSEWTTNSDGMNGYWFSGSVIYGQKVSKIFLPAAGGRSYLYGDADERGADSFYWSCIPTNSNDNSRCLYFSRGGVRTDITTIRGEGYPVRCVQDDDELIPVQTLTTNLSTLELYIGDSETLSANILPSTANHKTVCWSSDNSAVATVDAEGVVTAKSSGSAIITAMAGMQTAECVVTVVAASTVDMSLSGTANSYIVSQKGSYKFKTVKGNSSESVGAVASAEVLWETFGTDVTPNVGDLVRNVSYTDGEVTFQTADTFKEGNAVIAAKDASGNILWSWHIWLTDEPQGQVYYNNAGTMMDRNLGATSATPGDVGALGLLYQWGRKDPFLGSSSISSSIEAKSTGTWPSAVSSNSTKGTIEYATAYPTTFIKYTSSNYDWFYTGSSTTDNTRWTTSATTKSIYDPCPSGWRVPDGGDNGIWSKALGSSSSFTQSSLYDSTNEGMNFSGKFGSDQTIWYPASGYRYYFDGSLYNDDYYGGFCWSASPNGGRAYSLGFSNGGSVFPSYSDYRAYGQSVRCLQE